MDLWKNLFEIVSTLRPAFSRQQTFLWFSIIVAGFCIPADLLGISSIIRSLNLNSDCYHSLLGFFHSEAIKLHKLRELYFCALCKFGSPYIYKINNRYVLLADGQKVPKSGKKMPGVKKLHQESESNTKPEYITGHMLQGVALVIKTLTGFGSIPLGSEIHDGIKNSPNCRKTLFDKLLVLLKSFSIQKEFYLVADAYYGAGKLITGLLEMNSYLITRMKKSAVGYEIATTPIEGKRGRKKKYGDKVKLYDVFQEPDNWQQTTMDIYGGISEIEYKTYQLYWRPAGIIVLFVFIRTNKSCYVLMSTDTNLSALEVIKLYSVRMKIEVGFKVSMRLIPTNLYHFWMKKMTPSNKNTLCTYLHRKNDDYRTAVMRKISAYNVHLQCGSIAQGILWLLALQMPKECWKNFGSWMRTMNIKPKLPKKLYNYALGIVIFSVESKALVFFGIS